MSFMSACGGGGKKAALRTSTFLSNVVFRSPLGPLSGGNCGNGLGSVLSFLAYFDIRQPPWRD